MRVTTLPRDLWPARVHARLNEKRHAAGLPPLEPSAALTDVAVRAARECGEQSAFDERAILAHAHAQLERQTLRYRRVSAAVMLTADPTEAADLEGALDPDALDVGIGIAEQRASGPHAPSVAVVLIFGTRR